MTINGTEGNDGSGSTDGANGGAGISVSSGTLTITGTGTLTTTGGKGGDSESGNAGTGGNGIYIASSASLIINSGIISANGGVGGKSSGSQKISDFKGKGVVIESSGNLTINGGNLTATGFYGIAGPMTVTGGAVSAIGTDGDGYRTEDGTLSVSGGKLSFKGSDANKTIEKGNGTVTFTGGMVNIDVSSYVDTGNYKCIKNKDLAISDTYEYIVLPKDNYQLVSASTLSGQGGVTFKLSSDSTSVDSAAKEVTITTTAVAVDGYKATLSSSDVTLTTDANGVVTFTMPEKAVTVTATYTPYAYLDLETSTTEPETKTIDQPYTFAESGSNYTDVTKVKVEWTLPDISVSYTSNKIWDPDTMTWKESSKSTADIGSKTAEFTFTNYSSVAVGAKVSFEKTIVKDNSPYASDVLTLQSVVDPTTHEKQNIDVPTGKITHTYTPTTSDFDGLTAGTGKYGTYTVTIVSAVKVTFNMNGHGDAFDQYVGTGGKVAEPTEPTANGYTFGGWYTDAGCTESNKWNFTDNTVSEAKTLYAKWTQN